jgi:hypothetical protein
VVPAHTLIIDGTEPRDDGDDPTNDRRHGKKQETLLVTARKPRRRELPVRRRHDGVSWSTILPDDLFLSKNERK